MSDEALDKRMKAAGMLTVSESLGPGPMDGYYNIRSVNSLQDVQTYIENELATYLKVLGMHDLGEHVWQESDLDFILGKMAILRSLHVTLRRLVNEGKC